MPGVEAYREESSGSARTLHYARTLQLPAGPAVLELSWSDDGFTAAVRLAHPGDLAAVRERVEHLCDLDREITPVERWLSRDPLLGSLVAASPGLRVPGTVDAEEQLFRTMIGQQISLAGAASLAGKLVLRFGEPWPDGPDTVSTPAGPLTRLFPTASALAGADPATLPMPAARAGALVGVARALATGELALDPTADPAEVRTRLLAQRGIGPWTADYVLVRALRHPDVLLETDLVIRRELLARRVADTTRWSPWRSYATMHLWQAWLG